MREEVSGVGDQDNQTTLNLGNTAKVGKFEQQSSANANNEANKHAAEEDEQKDSRAFKEADDAEISSLALLVLLRSFENDDGDGVIEDRLSKDDGIQLGVNLVGVEDCENSDRVSSGESCADGDRVDKGHAQRSGEQCKDVQDQANNDSRQKGSSKGKSQDGANVAEEVGLM